MTINQSYCLCAKGKYHSSKVDSPGQVLHSYQIKRSRNSLGPVPNVPQFNRMTQLKNETKSMTTEEPFWGFNLETKGGRTLNQMLLWKCLYNSGGSVHYRIYEFITWKTSLCSLTWKLYMKNTLLVLALSGPYIATEFMWWGNYPHLGMLVALASGLGAEDPQKDRWATPWALSCLAASIFGNGEREENHLSFALT